MIVCGLAACSPEKPLRVLGDVPPFQLLDQQGQVMAQADSPLSQGLSPTRAWRKGDIIQDTHVVPSDGVHASALLIGVYDPATGERLTATQNGQSQTNQAFQYPLLQ